MNKHFPIRRALPVAFMALAATLLQLLTPFGSRPALAQDTRELEREAAAAQTKKGPHPLTQLMQTANSRLRPELRGRHPRVYVTDSELQALRGRARTTHKEVWQLALQQMRALKVAPPSPPAEERRGPNKATIRTRASAAS